MVLAIRPCLNIGVKVTGHAKIESYLYAPFKIMAKDKTAFAK